MRFVLLCYRKGSESGSEAILACVGREDISKELTFEL